MIVVDPAGNLAPVVAGMVEPDRLVYVDKNNPITINPFTRYGSDWEKIADELVDVINNIVVAVSATDRFTVLMGELIRNAVRVICSKIPIADRSIKYLHHFLSYKEYREFEDIYWKNLWNSKELWEQRQSPRRVAARLSAFFDNPLMESFTLGPDEFDPRKIAEDRKVYCFNIHGFSPDKIVFLGNMITNAVRGYYQGFASVESPPLFVFIDEFHMFMSKTFGLMLAECGKFNISLNLSHHTHEQIEKPVLDAALGNSFTKCVFGCGYNEALRMCHEIRCDIDEFFSLGKYEAMLQIGNDFTRIRTYPPPKVEPYRAEDYVWQGDWWEALLTEEPPDII